MISSNQVIIVTVMERKFHYAFLMTTASTFGRFESSGFSTQAMCILPDCIHHRPGVPVASKYNLTVAAEMRIIFKTYGAKEKGVVYFMLIRVMVDRVTLDTSTSRFVVILKEENHNRWLPIVVGSSEAQAIALQLENIAPPRPLTHDLIRNLLSALDVKLERIVVNDLRDNTYYALLDISMGSDSYNIDVRPSDAIALALRAQAPIFVEGNVMRQASITDEETQSQREIEDDIKSTAPEDILEQLNVDLMKAVQEERYEEAAKIRDEITKFKADLRH